MSDCRNCGAPMPPKTLVCPYCKTRHDLDLKGVHHYSVEEPESERICPRCDKTLKTINLKIDGKFLIEKCDDCLGLFFDNGELETLVEKSVSNVHNIDYKLLQDIKNLKRHQDFPVTYIKCPVCRKLMNRINYGAQCGVIVDKCRDHGIWLDGGELRQILEWTKAGGQIHNEKRKIEMEKEQLRQEKERLKNQPTTSMGGAYDFKGFGDHDFSASHQDWDVLTVISKLVGKLVRWI